MARRFDIAVDGPHVGLIILPSRCPAVCNLSTRIAYAECHLCGSARLVTISDIVNAPRGSSRESPQGVALFFRSRLLSGGGNWFRQLQ